MTDACVTDLSNRARLRKAVEGKDAILRGVSALEYMEMFVGYIKNEPVEIYTKTNLVDEDFDQRIVVDFKQIDYFKDGDVKCATFNQVANDMLSEFETMDDRALAEALAGHYEENGHFEDLIIEPQYHSHFEEMKEWAREYYYKE